MILKDIFCIENFFSPQNLPQNIHVIALDLPGNGESEPPEEGTDLSFKGLVHSVHQVSVFKFTCTKLFHLAFIVTFD